MASLTFYIVSNVKPTSNLLDFTFNICTIVTTKEQVRDFILNKRILKHADHYQRWAELRQLNIQDPATKKEYARKVLAGTPDDEKYAVKKVKYKIEGIASVLRMFNGCTPVGASYETQAELIYFSDMYKKYLESQDKKE